MMFEHERSFVKQIITYLKGKEYGKACELSKQFVDKHPNSMMAHYLFAKSCYWKKDFVSALAEGHKALNLSEAKEDMAAAAVFLACVYYELKRFTRGYEVLTMVRHLEDEKVEKALFILSLCKDEPETALMHVDALYKINKEVAESFVGRFLELAKGMGVSGSAAFLF